MKISDDRDHPEANEDSPRMAVFLRGLSIGALVGAAIAGSAIWERARRRVEQRTASPEPAQSQPEGPRPEA
jgi:hypothetical protein